MVVRLTAFPCRSDEISLIGLLLFYERLADSVGSGDSGAHK